MRTDDPQGTGFIETSPSWVTSGNLHSAAWRLAGPTIVVAALEAAYTLVELFFVGKLGKEAVAAITLGAVTVGVVRTFCMGITSACTALVARAVGEGDRARAEKAIGQGLLIAVVLSVLVALVGVPLSEHFIRWFPSKGGKVISEETLVWGTRYLQVAMAGSFALLFTTVFAAGLRGAGDAVTPLVLIGVGFIVGMGLNPILIFGRFGFAPMGVTGAALAGVLGRAVGALLLGWMFFMRGHRSFHLHLRDLRPDVRMIKTMFRIGVFGSGQGLTRNISGLILAKIATGFGGGALAAHGIAMRLRMSVMTPGMGFGVAAATLVGQNLGARNSRRAERSGWLVSFLYASFALAVSVVCWFFGGHLVGVFNDQPDVVATGARLLRWFAVCFPLMTFTMVLGRAMQGAGDTLSPMLLTVFSLFGIRIPLAFMLSHLWNSVDGVWGGLSISIAIEGILIIAVFHWGRWKKVGERYVTALGAPDAGEQ